MRAGFSLAMISSQSPLLPSLLRSANGIVLSSSSSSRVGRPWLLRPISLISDTAAGGPRAEWKQLRLPRITIAAPFFFPLPFRFPLLAGCGLRNFCSLRASQASDSSASIDSNTIQSMETKEVIVARCSSVGSTIMMARDYVRFVKIICRDLDAGGKAFSDPLHPHQKKKKN